MTNPTQKPGTDRPAGERDRPDQTPPGQPGQGGRPDVPPGQERPRPDQTLPGDLSNRPDNPRPPGNRPDEEAEDDDDSRRGQT
jgi:hypothetical protein